MPWAAVHPLQVRVAPIDRRPDLPSLSAGERDGLASLLVELLGAVERSFPSPVPYMFWWVQRPADGGAWPHAWLHLELASPWRADGLPRFIAAGELGGGVLINPVDPRDACARLRNAL